MNEITKNAMLTRWRRMAEANVTGAYDIYSFLKGAIEYAGNADDCDPWDDTTYCNSDFTGIVEPLLNGFKHEYAGTGLTGVFNVWHTHGVKCAEFSEAAFQDLEQYIFNSRVGSYLYAGFADIPTYRQVWAQMNPVTVRKPRRSRKSA